MTKRKLTIHEAVRDEVVDAVVYYEEQQLGLGNSLLEEWEKSINKIHLTPEAYQIKRKHFREVLLDKFPYLIVFETTDTEVFVYRFINAKRHQNKRYVKRKN